MACGICGSSGHNRRTHAEHEEPQSEALIGSQRQQGKTAAVEAWAAEQEAAGHTVHRVGRDRVVEPVQDDVALPIGRTVTVGDMPEAFRNHFGLTSSPASDEASDLAEYFAAVNDTSSEVGKEEDGSTSADSDAGQSPERCAACDVRLTDGESFLCSDCIDAPPVVPGGPDVMVPHECEPAPDQVYYCRHCGADLMVEDDAPEPWITPPWRTALGPDEPIRITLPGVYDLTAEQYHNPAITGDWFSNSDAKKLLATCPAQFKYDQDNGVRKISDAFDFGHVWHAVILGKGEAYQVFEPKKLDGRTADGKAQKREVDAARAAGITPIYGDQFALIEAMAEAVKADPVPHALLTAPGRQEVCLFWEEQLKVTNPHNKLYGQTVTVKRRAMIDHLPDMPDDPRETVRLVDGKTADQVKPDDDMRKKIYDYAYHRQAETYSAAVEALFNRDAEVVFIFQSKKAPHLITPVDLDTPAIRVAQAENRQALELWAECVATGEWPGYTKGIVTSGVPAWIERQYEDELVIG